MPLLPFQFFTPVTVLPCVPAAPEPFPSSCFASTQCSRMDVQLLVFPAHCLPPGSRAPQAAPFPWDHSFTLLRKDWGNPNQPFCRAVPPGKLPRRDNTFCFTPLFQKAMPRVPNKYDILSSYFANILLFSSPTQLISKHCTVLCSSNKLINSFRPVLHVGQLLGKLVLCSLLITPSAPVKIQAH